MSDVYDLTEIGALCVDLSSWYDDFASSGDGSLHTLDGLLTRIRDLPTVSGRIGSAFALLEAGGVDDGSATATAFVDIGTVADRYRAAVHRQISRTTRPSRSLLPRRCEQIALFAPDDSEPQ